VKLAKDIDGGDDLVDPGGDPGPLRVYRVQRLPDGHLMVSWWAGNEVTGLGGPRFSFDDYPSRKRLSGSDSFLTEFSETRGRLLFDRQGRSG
jgi:hypothetical protein